MTRVLLVATYELGQQPGNLARPAALLTAAGHEVRMLDTSIDPWDPALVSWSDAVAFSVPMHTATRLARDLLAVIDRPTCCYGLYAHLCADVANRTIAGEYEAALVEWANQPSRTAVQSSTELGRAADADRVSPSARTPHVPTGAVRFHASFSLRAQLPPLDRYAHLIEADGVVRWSASVETTRGCAHRCRHCPVPVIYDGRVRVQDERAVLDEVAQLAAAGATHLTYGDPDFLNAPQHACRIVHAVHEQFPNMTFDCTVKVEHILRHADVWADFADRGCLFVVSAFESVDYATLERLDKGHTTADAAEAVEMLREHRIDVRPSFLPFTPWTTRESLVALLDFVHEHDLVASVDPVQYTIRLLLPPGSLLLDHPDMAHHLGDWDAGALSYRWTSADPGMDELQVRVARTVEDLLGRDVPTIEIYAQVREQLGAPPVDLTTSTTSRARLSESWFCCAEPTTSQLDGLAVRTTT